MESQSQTPMLLGSALAQPIVTRRYHTSVAKSEITSVGISHTPSSQLAAYAIYASGPLRLPWIDMFDLGSCRPHSKVEGAYAVYSPDGSRLVTLQEATSRFGTTSAHEKSCNLVLRGVDNGKAQLEIRGVIAGPVAWSKDGILIAASEGGNRVGVWDARVGIRIGQVISHIDVISHIGFTPDMSVVTLSKDGTLRITDPRTGKTLRKLEIEGASANNPRFLSISANGKTIVSVWGTIVHVWTPQANQLISYSLSIVRQSEGWPLAASPDGRYLVFRTEDGFDIAEAATGTHIFESTSGALVTAGSFGGSGDVLALGRMDGTFELWDFKTGE